MVDMSKIKYAIFHTKRPERGYFWGTITYKGKRQGLFDLSTFGAREYSSYNRAQDAINKLRIANAKKENLIIKEIKD